MIGLAMMLAAAGSDRVTFGPQPILNQRQLDAISTYCRTPNRWLQRRKGEIAIDPDRPPRRKQLECLIDELNRRQPGPKTYTGTPRQ